MSEQIEDTPQPYVPGPDEVPTGETDPNTGEPIYETPEPPPAQATSDYFKISRALEGDMLWHGRVKIALEIRGMEIAEDAPPRAALVAITRAVVDQISCTTYGAVDTSAVTDESIDAAIAALGGVS